MIVRRRWHDRFVPTPPYWTDVVQVVIVGVQLLVLIGAAFFAWGQVTEARSLREQQIRPFVVIDFHPAESIIWLQIENIGTTLAHDVRFEITPPFETTLSGTPLMELKMFRDGITTLAPGKKVRTLFDAATQRMLREDLPDLYSVAVTYTDESGTRSFTETLDLDLGIYKNLSYIVRYGEHDIHARLKDIHGEMKKWTAGTGGVLRLSPKERRAEDKRRSRALEKRFRKQRRTDKKRRAELPPPAADQRDAAPRISPSSSTARSTEQ